MQQTYQLHGVSITIDIKENSVHITNNKALWQFLSQHIDQRTTELVSLIGHDFQELNNRELAITNDSLAVEIWGHVYFEYWALAIDHLFKLKLISSLVDAAVKYSEIIDCGEEGFDSNRKLWDFLAPQKSRIASWLPEHIDKKEWKN